MNKDPKRPQNSIEEKLVKAEELPEEQPRDTREIIEDPMIKKEVADIDPTYIPIIEDI